MWMVIYNAHVLSVTMVSLGIHSWDVDEQVLISLTALTMSSSVKSNFSSLHFVSDNSDVVSLMLGLEGQTDIQTNYSDRQTYKLLRQTDIQASQTDRQTADRKEGILTKPYTLMMSTANIFWPA